MHFPAATVNSLKATVDKQRKDLFATKAKLDSLKARSTAIGVCACFIVL